MNGEHTNIEDILHAEVEQLRAELKRVLQENLELSAIAYDKGKASNVQSLDTTFHPI